MAKLKSDSGKRVKRMSITVSENIYGGVRALAALYSDEGGAGVVEVEVDGEDSRQ